jgi:hypothetical protein
MNVLDGGHDAPARPVSPRGRHISWIVLAATIVLAVTVLAVRFL